MRGWGGGVGQQAIDAEAVEWVAQFIGQLKHTKGQWAGVRFDLLPWQRTEIIEPIFGNLDEDGLRRVRTAYIEIPRKNGKSVLAAALALYLLLGDDEYGAEVYSAAGDKDQASIVFNLAASMVRSSPQLLKRCKVLDSVKRIVVPSTDSFYRAIPAEAAGSHGFNAHGIIFDELHVQPNRDLWDVLTTSTGAREQPLTIAITTAGIDRKSICYEQHDYAEKVGSGVLEDPTFFSYIKAAPKEANWKDPAVWREVNPGLGSTVKEEYLEAQSKKAQQTPAYENTFRRLHLNQWTSQQTRYMPMDAWRDAAGDLDVDGLKRKLVGRRCYAGLDLASTTDIAALALIFPDEDDTFDLMMHFWIPEENMWDRSRRDRVPYDVWVREGWVEATPGNVIDYKAILQTIDVEAQTYDIEEIAYDPWGATKLVQDIEEQGMTVVPFRQGFASLSPPTKELLNLVLSNRLHHAGNPVLEWMADNLVVRMDPAGNVKPDKSKSTEKIDGMVAMIMAIDRAIRHQDSSSVYEERGLRFF